MCIFRAQILYVYEFAIDKDKIVWLDIGPVAITIDKCDGDTAMPPRYILTLKG